MKENIPLWFKFLYILSVVVAFYIFFPQTTVGKTTVEQHMAAVHDIAYDSIPRMLASNDVIDTFIGRLTGYGPDCEGCSGITAYGYNVTNGNIYYNDDMYGNIRIVAADPKFKFGTIVRITAPKVLSEPIIAIVLDRGGGIKNNHFDLLYNNEAETAHIGLQTNIKYEVLRVGW